MTFCPLQNWKRKMSRRDVDKTYLGGNWGLPGSSPGCPPQRTNSSCLEEMVFLEEHLMKCLVPFILCQAVCQWRKKKKSRC